MRNIISEVKRMMEEHESLETIVFGYETEEEKKIIEEEFEVINSGSDSEGQFLIIKNNINPKNRLTILKKKYEDVTEAINLIKADGDLSKLINLRDQFDETFDYFFDSKEIANKYDWDNKEQQRAFNLTNKEIEQKLDIEDLKSLCEFYESYIDDLENEYIELGGEMAELQKIYDSKK